MSSAKCALCGKTAYPLESVTALEKSYHKSCFKCSVCNTAVNLKNFKGVDGKIYCITHTPKPTSTAVTDSIAVKQALNAPKKTAEGLSTVQKGTGEKPSVGLDNLATQHALNAPKKTAEGLSAVQKGTGEKPSVGLDTVQNQTALKAPKKTAEGLRTVQKGQGGKPNYAVFGADPNAPAVSSTLGAEGEVQVQEGGAQEEVVYEEQQQEEQQQYEGEAPAEEAGYEQQQYEYEQPAEGEQQYEEAAVEDQ